MTGRIGIEGGLDGLPALFADAPVEGHDPLTVAIGTGDGRLELLDQIPLRVRVLGEDQHAAVVPPCVRCAEVRAEVRLHPGDEMPDPAVGLIPGAVWRCRPSRRAARARAPSRRQGRRMRP